MAKRAKSSVEKLEATVEIVEITKRLATVYLLGTSPLVMNRMPKKAREQILWPSRKKNRAELSTTRKHDPIAEFNDAIYRCREPSAPTLVHLPNGCFKKAMAQAALDIPGATKAQIGRLVSIADPTIHLYGIPKLYMAIVRLAGPSRAPDIRTRAIFQQWACKITVGYIRSLITENDVLRLLAAAGVITGIGDGRTERGAFDFGQWEIVGANNAQWKSIVAKQGRAAQEKAMAAAETYDADTDELLGWYRAELVRREQEPDAPDAADDGDDDGDADDEFAVATPKQPHGNGGEGAPRR